MKISSPILASAIALGISVSAHAATVNWDPGTTISGDLDVSLLGDLDRAFTFRPTAVTINTVTFSPYARGTSDTFGVQDASSYGNTTNAPFAGLSADYQDLLRAGMYLDNSAPVATFTLTGLTPGTQYLVQTWVNDSRGCCGPNRSETLDGGLATLMFNAAGVDGGVGQYAIGTFTADATSQDITYAGFGNDRNPAFPPSAQVNGIQLRVVPEPATLGLLGLSTVGLMILRRRRR